MNNWQTKKLGEICDIFNGNSINARIKKEKYFGLVAGYSFIATKDVGFDNTIDYENGVKIPQNESKFKISKKNSVLICAEGGSAGRKVGFTEKDVCFGNKLFSINSEKQNNKFIYYFCFTNYFQKEFKKGLAGIIGGVSLKKFEDIKIPLPPLPEQHRIVKILDEIFENTKKAKENTEKNLQNSKELFESYLQNVFANPGKEWEEKNLKLLTSKIGSGATPRGGKESYIKEGISLVRSMNVHDRNFVEKNLAFIDSKQAKDLSNVTLEKGDVLLNITGASVARCCVFDEKYLPARVNQHVSIIRPRNEIIDSAFLNYLLTSKIYKDQLLVIGGQGATRQAITKAQLEDFNILYPKSFSEQKSIVARLDALSGETKKLEAIYKQKLADLEELKKSVLKKAFSGEL